MLVGGSLSVGGRFSSVGGRFSTVGRRFSSVGGSGSERVASCLANSAST